MGKVRVLVRLLPADPTRGFNKTLEEVREKASKLGFSLVDQRVEDVAFGIKNLYLLITVDEERSNMAEVERALSSLNNVGSIEIVGMTRA